MKYLIVLTALVFFGSAPAGAQTHKKQSLRILTEHMPRAVNSSGSQELRAASMPCVKDSMVSYYWNTLNSSFTKTSKNVYAYNATFSVSTDTYYSYYSNSWNVSNRLTNSYNLLNQKTMELREYASGGQPIAWYPSSRTTYTYDNYGYQTQNVYQSYNSQTSTWKNSSQELNVYDSQHNNTQQISLLWRNNAWRNNFQTLTTFNSQNHITGSVYQSWDTITNNWKSTDKLASVSYGSNGKIAAYTVQEWINNIWENSYRASFSYNSAGFETMELDEEWNGTTWENLYRSTIVYDSKNNPINFIYEEWDGTGWVLQSKSTMGYDTNNNQISSLYEYVTNHILTPSSKNEMFYNCTTVGIHSVAQTNTLSIFPNPANKNITIKTTISEGRIIIRDIHGRVVQEDLLKEEIQLENLPEGLYMISLVSPEGTTLATARVIKN